MSFQDPDDRDRARERAENRRAECVRRGRHDFKHPADPCHYCGNENPASKRPYVAITHNDIRGVYNPATESLTIERLETDAMGATLWQRVDHLTAARIREIVASSGIVSAAYLFQLLSKGRTPT